MPPPPAIVWELQERQTLAQNKAGTFCIKYLSIVYMDMGFFYAFKMSGTSQPVIPDVVATSLLEVDGGSIHTKLSTRVESLGYLGAWNVAPIFFRIPRTHEAVQVILLTQEDFLSFAGPMVNPLTFHTEGHIRLDEAQPISILHPREPRSPMPAPRFEHLHGMEWPFGNGGGGGTDMFYWHGVLKADVEISEIVNHYAAQLMEAKWSRIEGQQNDEFVWQTWTVQDEDDAIWKGLFLILNNPEVERQYIFYARADRVTPGF